MKLKKMVVPIALASIAVIVFALYLNSGSGGLPEKQTYSVEDKKDAIVAMNSMYESIRPQMLDEVRGNASIGGVDLWAALPSLDKYPPQIEATTSLFVEILSSTEKATLGPGGSKDLAYKNAWLLWVADKYNASRRDIDGETGTVQIRGMDSGLAVDYLISGKISSGVAISFSNNLWAKKISSHGLKVDEVTGRLVGNVAGLMVSNKVKSEIEQKYGSVSIESIRQAVISGDIRFGYTNPKLSSTGLNFMTSLMYDIDPNNPLGDSAIAELQKFQENIQFWSETTIQMSTAAQSGALECFIYEYQQLMNNPELKKDYTFIPFGVRHDNPVHIVGEMSEKQVKLLEDFIQFASSSEMQAEATKRGFNQIDDYVSNINVDDDVVNGVQGVWKENKDAGRDVVCVFVADVSGSMRGPAIESVRTALREGAKVISDTAHIGLVTYSDVVNIATEIGQFDFDKRSMFAGAVDSMADGGGTATYDAVMVAEKMIYDYTLNMDNAKAIIIVMTDGDTQAGYNFKDVKGTLGALGVPIYSIGYNLRDGSQASTELSELSSLNEANKANADTEDVIYLIQALLDSKT